MELRVRTVDRLMVHWFQEPIVNRRGVDVRVSFLPEILFLLFNRPFHILRNVIVLRVFRWIVCLTGIILIVRFRFDIVDLNLLPLVFDLVLLPFRCPNIDPFFVRDHYFVINSLCLFTAILVFLRFFDFDFAKRQSWFWLQIQRHLFT